MAEVKCIACHKVNGAGDRFCAACGSSLDLQVCAACEAVNNPVAESCHSCGKPLLTPVLAAGAVEVAEAPFYPPQRWQVYDARPSLASRFGHAAKLALFVALPLAAIAVWAHQLYGERWLRVGAPSAQTPAAAGVTAPVPEPLAQAEPPVVETKQPAAETKRPLAQAQAPAATAGVKRARTVTHTSVTAVAPATAAVPAAAVVPAAEAAPAPVTRGRVTHTRASALAPAAPALPAVAESPAAPGCPEAVAALGRCTSNEQGGH